MNIKFRVWDGRGKKWLNKDNYLVDCDGVAFLLHDSEVFEVHDVEVIFSTGAPVERGGFFTEPFIEVPATCA